MNTFHWPDCTGYLFHKLSIKQKLFHLTELNYSNARKVYKLQQVIAQSKHNKMEFVICTYGYILHITHKNSKRFKCLHITHKVDDVTDQVYICWVNPLDKLFYFIFFSIMHFYLNYNFWYLLFYFLYFKKNIKSKVDSIVYIFLHPLTK